MPTVSALCRCCLLMHGERGAKSLSSRFGLLGHLPAGRPWVSSLPFLSFTFSVCEVGVLAVCASWGSGKGGVRAAL